MFTFMFGVLGSVAFWALYFGVSLFAGTFILKRLSPDTLGRILGTYEKPPKRPYCDEDDIGWFFLVIVAYLFWPFFILCYLIKFILIKICLNCFRSAVIFADKNMPEVSIKKVDIE